ncbi:MAG: response regulator transcription factor [Oscillospiraceae bacterium]|nr:response regulator transcription factor [Oscillospiraceae bacterium]
MIKIAICDDEQREIETANKSMQLYLASHPEIDAEVYEFSSAIELLNQIENQGSFDILLLDIFLPGIHGIDVARQLREDRNKCQIIFLTTSRDYAVEAFAVNAVHYILKPYSVPNFFDAMDKAVRKAEENNKQYLSIFNRGNVYALDLKAVLYVESNNHSQFIYSLNDRPIELRMTMSELFETLSHTDFDFYRLGKAYIVNLKQIRQLSAKEVVFNGGKHLPVPRGAFNNLKDAFMLALFEEVKK